VDLIVHLDSHAVSVTLSDAEAAGKNNIVFNVIFCNCALKKPNNCFGALEMAGRANTNLNDQHIFLYLCGNFVLKKLTDGLGRNGVELLVYHNANALLAIAKAESAAKLNLIAKVIIGDQTLKLFNDLTGTFDVAGTSDTYCNLHKTNPRIYIIFCF
jgi:hypothetical protein